MARRIGRICGKGNKKIKRGSMFLKITRAGVVYDVSAEFGHPTPRKKTKTKPKKRTSSYNFGRKKSGRLRGFSSMAQRRAALANVKKAQRARRRGY